MPSIGTRLRSLRQQVEALQVEVAGRQNISSMAIWDEQNLSSVNQESPTKAEPFNGLIVHLTPELSQPEGTFDAEGISQNEFNELKQEIVRAIS